MDVTDRNLVLYREVKVDRSYRIVDRYYFSLWVNVFKVIVVCLLRSRRWQEAFSLGNTPMLLIKHLHIKMCFSPPVITLTFCSRGHRFKSPGNPFSGDVLSQLYRKLDPLPQLTSLFRTLTTMKMCYLCYCNRDIRALFSICTQNM